MMTLALLLTVATGAWAESKPIGLNVEYAAGDEITSTTNVYVWSGYFLSPTIIDPQEGVIMITSNNPATISEIANHEQTGYITLNSNREVISKDGITNLSTDNQVQCQGKVTGTLEKVHVVSGSGTLADPYVFAPGSAPAAATPVPLTWDAATPNTATLTNGMPAGNVTVSVEYYPQATMAEGAVTAATDVKATTEDALVTIDKSKLNGVAKLMYFVSTDAEATAPAYTATGWTDVLPTAANYTEAADLKVWYYAVGADNEDPDKTYSDGDICATALTVTLGAAPLWNAEFDLTDAPAEDKAPGVWKTDITGEGVKKGTPVTVTYTGSKKIIGVKAEKKAAPKLLNFSPMGQIFYYYEGETWGEAIQNHPENAANGWSIEEFGTTVTYKGRALCDSEHDDDITKYTVVNPNGGYMWGPEP